MDIACPNCSAAYRVPDALVFSRKPVRCAACGTRWVPDLPQEVTLGPAGPLPGGAPVALPDAPAADPVPAPPEPVQAPPPAGRSFGPAEPEAEADAPPRPASMSIGPVPTEITAETAAEKATGTATEAVTETGALTPKPAAPPPLAETRWMPGAKPKSGAGRVRGAALLPLAWAGSLLAVGGLLAILALYRNEIAAAWPPFGWVVRLLGG